MTSLKMIADTITGEIHGIIQLTAFHGYMFMRNRTWLAKNSVIHFGIYSQEAGITTANALVDYFVNPTFGIAQRFYLFLFSAGRNSL